MFLPGGGFYTIVAGSSSCSIWSSDIKVHSAYAVEYITNRSRNAPSVDIQPRAVHLGHVSFVIAPCEMFDDNGLFIKESSPPLP